MLVREPSWKYSANLVHSSLGEILVREPRWEYSSNCDEAIFGVQKASLNMCWEHSPYSPNIASDWLRAELVCGGGRKKRKKEKEREKKKGKKWMTVSLGSSLASEGFFYIFVDSWEARPCLGDTE